jgi:hypothetical protein
MLQPPLAVTATVLVRKPSTYCRTCCSSQTRTSVCQLAVEPLPEAGLSTLACSRQSLLEETIHSHVPLLDEPERKKPSVPGFSIQPMSRATV